MKLCATALRRTLRRMASVFIAAAAIAGFQPQDASAHGFDPGLDAFNATDTAAVASGRPLTFGQLRILIAQRIAPFRTGDFIFFGMTDLVDCARSAPVYTELAAQARAAGVQLTPEQIIANDQSTRDFERRIFFRESVLDTMPRPTMDDLRTIYESQKDTRFLTTEKLIMRRILIPHSADEEQALQQANAIHARLEAGETFFDVLNSVEPSEEGRRARIIEPGVTSGIPADVLATLKNLENKKFSAPIRTDDGYWIIYRQFHFPASTVPFEAVLEVLADDYYVDARDKAIRMVMQDLSASVADFRIHSANLMNTGELALDTDVLIEIGDRRLTRGELEDALGWRLGKEARYRIDTFRDIALEAGPVQEALVDLAISRAALKDQQDAIFQRTSLEETWLTRNYLLSLAQPGALEPTEEEILAEYQLNPAACTEPITLDGLLFELPSTALDAVRFKMEFTEIDDIETFQSKAEEVIRRTSSGRLLPIGTEELRSYADRAPLLLKGMQSRGLSEPAVHGDLNLILYVKHIQWPSQPTGSALEKIRAGLRTRKQEAWIQNETLRRAEGVELQVYIPGY